MLDYNSQQELDKLLAGPVQATPGQAGMATQIARGGMSGLTMGMYKPFQDAGEGGLTETLARYGGGLLPWGVAAGLGGAGLGALAGRAGAGRLASMLLKPGAAGEGAVAASLKNVFHPFASMPSQFTRTGAGLASGLGGAAVGGIEAANEPGATPNSIMNQALMTGAGAGAWSGLMHGGGVKPPAAVVDETLGKNIPGAVGDELKDILPNQSVHLAQLQKTVNEKLENVQVAKAMDVKSLIRKAEKELGDATEVWQKESRRAGVSTLDYKLPTIGQAGAEGAGAATEATAPLVKDAVPLTQPSTQTIQSELPFPTQKPPQGDLFQGVPTGTGPAVPPKLPVQGPMRPPEEIVKGLSPEAVAGSVTGMPLSGTPSETSLRGNLTKLLKLSMKDVAPGFDTKQLVDQLSPEQIAELVRDFGAAGPGGVFKETEGRSMLQGAVNKMLQGPGGTLQPPPFAQASSRFVQAAAAHLPDSPQLIQSAAQWPVRIAKGISGGSADVAPPELLAEGVKLLQTGASDVVPGFLSEQARLATQAPFPDVRHTPPMDPLDLRALKASGFAQSAIMKAIAKSPLGGVLPISWLLDGTPAFALPSVQNQADHRAHELIAKMWETIPGAAQWDKETGSTLIRLYNQLAKDTPEAFQQAAAREAPGATPESLSQYRQLMERIRNLLVQDGKLKPEQVFNNYLPAIRDHFEVKQGITLSIEKGDEYFNKNLERSLSPKVLNFTKTRTILEPEFYPRSENMTIQDVIQTYIAQAARHIAMKESMPELQAQLKLVPPEMAQMVGEHVNYWMGKTGDRISDLNKTVRDLNFVRTIGFNPFSAVTNTMQRLNTFAVVGPAAFLKAFRDVYDPERLKLMEKAGLGDLLGKGYQDTLEKLGIDESVGGAAGSGPLRKLAQAGGRLFSISERANRTHAFMAGMREAEAKGITNQADIFQFARNVVDETQFIQSHANTPAAFRGGAGKILGQFQTFRLNQAHFMLRLVDEAKQGIQTGDLARVAPFMKFWGPTIALTGLAGLPMGEALGDELVKHGWGEAAKVHGLAELFFGVEMAHQLGMGSINADDLNSWKFFLPGPTISLLQTAGSVATGKDAGSGADLANWGKDLDIQERMRRGISMLPAGLAGNRALAMARLMQTDGEYRKAMDFKEVLGLAPSTGDLQADRPASRYEMLMQGLGAPLAFKERARREIDKERTIRDELGAAQNRAASYMIRGHADLAQAEIDKFNAKYGDELLAPVTGPTATSLQQAQRRQFMPPAARLRLPQEMQNMPGSFYYPSFASGQ